MSEASAMTTRYLTECRHTATWTCMERPCVWPCEPCTQWGDKYRIVAHVHCDCGAIKCHGYWWRRRLTEGTS